MARVDGSIGSSKHDLLVEGWVKSALFNTVWLGDTVDEFEVLLSAKPERLVAPDEEEEEEPLDEGEETLADTFEGLELPFELLKL